MKFKNKEVKSIWNEFEDIFDQLPSTQYDYIHRIFETWDANGVDQDELDTLYLFSEVWEVQDIYELI